MKKIYIFIFAVILLLASGCVDTKPKSHLGERIYSPMYRLYGNVDDVYENGDILGVQWDGAYYSQQGVDDNINVGNKTYLEIQDFPRYPSPVMKYYNIQWEGWYGNDEVNAQDARDVTKYCEKTYGNNTYVNKWTCRVTKENETSIIYYDHVVNPQIMTVFRLQNTLDKKSNLNTSKMVRGENQKILVYTPINYTLLRQWMDYYGLTYNNRNLNTEDFNEIKNNVPFMAEYCSIYGYTGYDGKACYRLAGADEKGKLASDPCDDPKSEEVASACVKIMEARFKH